jgi:nudix-type nucleoside diphosphatase (YffH/AdpP family)
MASDAALVAPTPGVPAIVARETVYRGWTSLERITLRLPGPVDVERHIEHHGDAACVLPYDPVRRVALLVSMPRPAVLQSGEDDLLEVVAGRIDDGELPDACAIREAMEEAGVVLSDLDPVAVGWSMPALSTERLHLFLGSYESRDRTGEGGGAEDEHENIVVREMQLTALWTLAQQGRVTDIKTLLLVHALHARRPELFG